jgi:hypothetical protein
MVAADTTHPKTKQVIQPWRWGKKVGVKLVEILNYWVRSYSFFLRKRWIPEKCKPNDIETWPFFWDATYICTLKSTVSKSLKNHQEKWHTSGTNFAEIMTRANAALQAQTLLRLCQNNITHQPIPSCVVCHSKNGVRCTNDDCLKKRNKKGKKKQKKKRSSATVCTINVSHSFVYI